jgi:hypothetical protein
VAIVPLARGFGSVAAPLSQVLHDGTSSYVYGNGAERLRAAGGAWYVPDALGSLRATLDGAGTLLASTSYDSWGLPQAGAIAPFGFTGEVQDAAGMVNLRARGMLRAAGVSACGIRLPGGRSRRIRSIRISMPTQRRRCTPIRVGESSGLSSLVAQSFSWRQAALMLPPIPLRMQRPRG